MTSERLATRPSKIISPAFTPVKSHILQRQCACGGTSGPTGECAACRRKRLGIQPKLIVNQPGDRYEREADKIAEQVMRMPESRLQRQPEPNDEEEEEELLQARPLVQRQVTDQTPTGVAPPIVNEVLRSPGQSLDQTTRAFMEPRFGHDFSHVRVHTDARAAESARAVNARAYTVGCDVVFGAGNYAPHTRSGRGLLGHELTHVVQQRHISTFSLFQPTLQRDDEPVEVELVPVTPEQRRRLEELDIDLPEVSEETWQAIGGEPLNKVGRPLSEGDRESAAEAAGVQEPTGPLDVTVQGARFVLHDTAATIGATRIRELQGFGRRSAGFGPAAYVPRSGTATIAHTPLFAPRRPTATEFEKGEDVMSESSRNAAYRRVWRATSRTRRLQILDALLAAQGSTGREATSERRTAISDLGSSSGNVHSAGIWTVEDICEQVNLLLLGAATMPTPVPTDMFLVSAGLADSVSDAQELTQACGALASLTATRASRIGSTVNVEIVQQGGSQCRTTGTLTRLPAYTDNQYRNVMQVYLRAALEAGQFPEITTHFWIDKNIGDHCDPRCFDLGKLYDLTRVALHHRQGSIYGIVPNYGTGATHNVWWHNTVCGGSPPTP